MKTIYGDLTNTLFEETNVKAKKVYVPTNKGWIEPFGVWQLEDDQFELLNTIPDNKWKDDYGWFNTRDDIVGGDLIKVVVNGEELLIYKEDDNFYHSDEYLEELAEEDEEWSLEYSGLLELAEYYYGMSYSWNVAALANTLAKANNLTLVDFLKVYDI